MLAYIKYLYIKIRINFSNSERKTQLYRKYFGVKIGRNARFTGKPAWGTEPYLIEIGNNVTITQEVYFYTHDGGVGLFRKEYPGINVYGRIIIGNNVFIGSHSIILPGVSVGNNVVIAAGSVVSKDIPDNSVVAGVPAKVMKSITEYKEGILKKAVYIHETGGSKRRDEILKKIKG